MMGRLQRGIFVAGAAALWLGAAGCDDRGGGERRADRPGGAGSGAGQASSGQQGGARGSPSSGPAMAGQTMTGQVVKAKKDEVTLKQGQGGEELKLKVDDRTQVMIDGKQASADNLKEGTQVRASFDSQKGERHATRIEATSGGAGTAGGTGAGDRPGGSAGTTGGLGGASSSTPGQMGGPGGGSATSASEPGAPTGQGGSQQQQRR